MWGLAFFPRDTEEVRVRDGPRLVERLPTPAPPFFSLPVSPLQLFERRFSRRFEPSVLVVGPRVVGFWIGVRYAKEVLFTTNEEFIPNRSRCSVDGFVHAVGGHNA